MQNTTQVKRSEIYSLYGHYHTQTQTLTPSEENFLDEFLKALSKINPSLHKSLTHMKRVGILNWILGWGVYSNARVFLGSKIIYTPYKNKISYKINKLNIWLNF